MTIAVGSICNQDVKCVNEARKEWGRGMQMLSGQGQKKIVRPMPEMPHNLELIDWLGMVLRLRQHNIGYTADGFYRSDDPTNSVKALKEGG